MSYEDYLQHQAETQQRNPDLKKYMLDDTTYVVKREPQSFWGAVMIKMFLAVIVYGIVIKAFITPDLLVAALVLLGLLVAVIVVTSFKDIYYRLTFCTSTGEMTYRRLFRRTWKFHKSEITAMEVKLDTHFGRISKLYLHLGERTIKLGIGRVNQSVTVSAVPGGLDKTLCDFSNIVELVEFLNVWECAVIGEREF